ncbi:hypothetical protein BDW71DRAFT_30961 [Aspergillus fruticulosus]
MALLLSLLRRPGPRGSRVCGRVSTQLQQSTVDHLPTCRLPPIVPNNPNNQGFLLGQNWHTRDDLGKKTILGCADRWMPYYFYFHSSPAPGIFARHKSNPSIRRSEVKAFVQHKFNCSDILHCNTIRFNSHQVAIVHRPLLDLSSPSQPSEPDRVVHSDSPLPQTSLAPRSLIFSLSSPSFITESHYY